MTNKANHQINDNRSLIVSSNKSHLTSLKGTAVHVEVAKTTQPHFKDALVKLNGFACFLVIFLLSYICSCSSKVNSDQRTIDPSEHANKSIDPSEYANKSMEELFKLDEEGDYLASLQLGRNIWKEHKIDDAIKYFHKASASNDLEIKKIALYNLGISQSDKGDSLIKYISKSADLEYAPAQGYYAANLIKIGKLKEGYEYAQKSIKQNDGAGYYALASYYNTLFSDPKLYYDNELPRDEDLLSSDNGTCDRILLKAADLGCVMGFYYLVCKMESDNCSKQTILDVINQYKDKYPEVAHDFIEITNNPKFMETERYLRGWSLMDALIK